MLWLLYGVGMLTAFITVMVVITRDMVNGGVPSTPYYIIGGLFMAGLFAVGWPLIVVIVVISDVKRAIQKQKEQYDGQG